MIQVLHLFLSPDHNYFGHHGGPAGAHPNVEVDALECVAGRGVRGDRFFDYKPDYKGQLTLFASEVLDAMGRELGGGPYDAAATRRNVITAGVELATLIGETFTIQGVRLVGTEECRPCYWMNEALRDARAEAWLAGRGGLRARIVEGGVLRVDRPAP